MFKKTIKLLLIMVILVPVILTPIGQRVDAAGCYPANTCSSDNIHYQKNMSVYYTKSQVKTIINRQKKLGSNSGQVITYVLAYKAPPIGLAALFANIGMNNAVKKFKTAYNKGTGVKISYTVIVYKHTNSYTGIKNTKIKYY